MGFFPLCSLLHLFVGVVVGVVCFVGIFVGFLDLFVCLVLCGWGVSLGFFFGWLVFGFGVFFCSLLNSCTGTVNVEPIYAEQ